MGQNEIFELLKNKRESGIEDYFTCKEIKILLCNNKDCNSSTNVSVISEDLRKMLDYLEVTAKGNLWSNCKSYRLKKKYCNGKKIK